jgi:hypothetical protein
LHGALAPQVFISGFKFRFDPLLTANLR